MIEIFYSKGIQFDITNPIDVICFIFYCFLNLQFLMGTGNGCYITHERALSGLVGPVGLISIAQLVEIVDPVAQSFVPHAYTNVREYVSIVVQGSMYMGFTYQLGCCLDSMLLYQVEIFSVRNQQLHAVGIVGAVSSWESTTHLFYFLN